MKAQTTKWMKRMIAITISLFLLIGLVPVSAMAAEGDNQSASSLDALLSISAAPDEFASTADPYGYGEGVAFNLAPQDELLYFYSDINEALGMNQKGLKYDIYEGISAGTHLNGWRDNLGDSINTGNSDYLTWGFVQAVSFDPYGTGRNTHLAYVGLDNAGDNWSFRLNVINLNFSSKKQASYSRWLGDANWIKNESQEDGFENFNASNFLSITAGDYDGDGKDTIVAFASADGTSTTLKEYYLSEGSDGVEEILDLGASNSLLHWTYQNTSYNGAALAKSTIAAQKLQADLATGDFDGDKKEDLAVVSYIGDIPADTVEQTQRSMFYAYLGIAMGGGNGKSIVNKSSMNCEFDLVKKNFNDKALDLSMTAPSVAIGDVDGDGYDEAVVAGYSIDVSHGSGGLAKEVKLSENAIVAAVYDVASSSGATKATALLFEQYAWAEDTDSPINVMTSDIIDSLKDNFNKGGTNHDVVMPQFQVATVATNGQGAAQDIFLNGTFVTYAPSGALEYKYQDDFFGKDDSSAEDMSIRFSFIPSVSVGVFDSNNAGREQIAYVVAQKDGEDHIYSGDNHDDYAYMVGLSGGCSYDDLYSGGEIVTYGPVLEYDTSGLDTNGYNSKDDYEFYNAGITTASRKNLVLAAVDVDSDGTVGKYVGKTYTYTDPNVLAILQAPPYFSDLGQYGYGNAGTTYAFTTAYTIGQTSGNTSSFSVGISSEVAVPGVKVAIGSGYNGTWEEEFTKAFTESFTTEFTATNKNTVVMQRTPVIIYQYLLQDENGNFENEYDMFGEDENYMTIAIPSQPVYALASIKEYNDFVNNYNSAMEQIDGYDPMNAYEIISDAYLEKNEGNPGEYCLNWNHGKGYGSEFTVGTGTGDTKSEYTVSSEDTEEKSSSHGFYFDTTVSAGSLALVAEVWVGVSASTEQNWSQGSFTTTTTETTTSGTVSDLGHSGVDAGILANYGFTWQFGRWDIDLGQTMVPAYGYSVTNVYSGVPAPQGLTVEDALTVDGSEAAKLTWTHMTGATYRVYLLNDAGSFTKLGETSDAAYTYVIPNDTRQYSFTFCVSAVLGGKESVPSESVTYYRQSHALSAFEIAVKNGFKGTEEEWLASLVGTDGSDGTGIDTAQINENGELILVLTDGTQINLGTVAGAAGEAGVGIASIYLNADGELQILLTDGTDMNLGVVVGKDGLDGSDGADGKDGIDGVNGKDGANGADGKDGADGVDGKDGADGVDGKDGADGVDGITPQFRINADTNEWEVSLDSGKTWTSTGVSATGDKGDKGERGEQGDTGVGIKSMEFDENGNLIVTLTDGTTQNLGEVPYPNRKEEIPDEEIPEADIPEADIPDVDIPEVEPPEVETPEEEKPEVDNPFMDISKDLFCYDAVLWAYENEITQGVDATHFDPGEDCTRAQIATFLWRTAGSPEPISEDNPFTDVEAGAYYYKAVLWAVEEGITNGTSATTFSPNANCTRGQVATFLWRAEQEPSASDPTNPFADLDEGAYYYDAVLWAVEAGVTNGVGSGRFAPNDTCTRGQIVTFLYRALGW